jgi:uncharacterized protein
MTVFVNLKHQIAQIAEHFHICELYVFGSRAAEIAARVRGESPPSGPVSASDVDIGVQPEPGRKLPVQEKVRLAIALEDLLDVGRVDLVVIPEADPFLATDVIRGELLFCADPDEQAETELLILRRAGDLAYYKRMRMNSILS